MGTFLDFRACTLCHTPNNQAHPEPTPTNGFDPTLVTMCDFHNFGLIFMGQMHSLPQRLKSTLFGIFSNGGCQKGTQSVENISNNIDSGL